MNTTQTIAPAAITGVRHSCGELIHTTDFQPVRVVKLGCGCTRNEGTRCNGTAMHVLSPVVCTRHQEEEAQGANELDEAASR